MRLRESNKTITRWRRVELLAAKEIFISIYSIFNKNANILRASAIAVAPSLHCIHNIVASFFPPRFCAKKVKISRKVSCLKGASLCSALHFSAFFLFFFWMEFGFSGTAWCDAKSLFANGGRIIVILILIVLGGIAGAKAVIRAPDLVTFSIDFARLFGRRQSRPKNAWPRGHPQPWDVTHRFALVSPSL